MNTHLFKCMQRIFVALSILFCIFKQFQIQNKARLKDSDCLNLVQPWFIGHSHQRTRCTHVMPDIIDLFSGSILYYVVDHRREVIFGLRVNRVVPVRGSVRNWIEDCVVAILRDAGSSRGPDPDIEALLCEVIGQNLVFLVANNPVFRSDTESMLEKDTGRNFVLLRGFSWIGRCLVLGTWGAGRIRLSLVGCGVC